MRDKAKSDAHEMEMEHQNFIKKLMAKNKKWRKKKWENKKGGKSKPSVVR